MVSKLTYIINSELQGVGMDDLKVYIILEKNLDTGSSNIYGVYRDKNKAKTKVDSLNMNRSEDENDPIDFVLESYEVI